MKSSSVHQEPVSILIVSVDSNLDQSLTSNLKEEGYEIEFIESVNDSIKNASTHGHDIILLDSDSPEGRQSLSFQSLIGQFPHIPVILTVPSQIDSQQRVQFIKDGAFDLISKPYQWHELQVILHRALVVRRLNGNAERISQKLHKSEEHFKSVVQASPDAIVLGDEWGNILSWNEAGQNMFGYTWEEAIGQPLTILMPSRFHQAHQEGLERVRTTLQTKVIGHVVELVGLRKGGKEFPIELSLSYSLVENKIFYCGIIRDVTPRKEAERALEESEDRFKLTIDQIHDAVFYGDLSGRILWANSQASILVGRPIKELVGHLLMECFSEKAAFLAESRLALVRGGVIVPPKAEFEIIRPDGSTRWMEANVTSVVRDQQIMGRLLVGRDITERRQSELALIERNRMLALDAQVGHIISQNQGLDPLLQACAEALVCHLDAAFARIWILEKNEDILNLKASAGLYTHLDGLHSRIPVGHLKVGQIAVEKKPILTNSVIGDPRIPDQEWAKREELVAFAGYPLLRDHVVVGVMALFSKQALTEFTLKGLGMVADRITTAIECQMATVANQILVRLNEQVLTSAGEGIYGLDTKGLTTFVNPAAAKMLGYERGELIGMPMHATMHHTKPNGLPYPSEECPMYAAFKDGRVYHEDNEVFWRKDGTSFPTEYTSTPIRGEHDNWVGAVVTFKDISERKRAEEMQQRFYQQLGATLAALPGSILVVDKDHQVVYANAKANQTFAPNQPSLLGSLVHKVLPLSPAQWKRLVEEFSCRNNGGEEKLQDQEIEANDRSYSYRLFPISLEEQECAQTGIVIWDITEKKKLQEQLIQSEKLSSLGTLVSGMVHEVRSPMQAIVGSADLIKEENDPVLIQELAGDIKRVSRHITEVLTDFMTYARPSSHEQSSEVNLNERLGEALKMVQRSPSFTNVEVVRKFNPLPPVSVRQGEIDQVFINLIGNAVQAMEGKGCLTLATFCQDNFVTAQISDTGCGIPKEILNKIFDPFFSTKGKGKGTGLGLSIVHNIVKSYGGQITIKSAVGKGTTFSLQFPEHL